MMRRIVAGVVLAAGTVFALGWSAPGQESAPAASDLRRLAASLSAEGRWAEVRDLFERVDVAALPATERRWAAFCRADARWRAAAGSNRADDGELQAARQALEALVAADAHAQERDAVWADAQESLGDWHWRRASNRSLGSALPHYQAALGWWAAARDVEAARGRYLAIVLRMFEPDGQVVHNSWWHGQIPLDLARNARSIAVDASDRARTTSILARRLAREGGEEAQRESIVLLREVAALERTTPGRDEALYLLAQRLEHRGEPRVDENGAWILEPEPAAALELYRRIVSEYRRGESAWFREAEQGIRRIQAVELEIGVEGAFLPGSPIAYALSWRNVGTIDLELRALDLARTDEAAGDGTIHQWLANVDLERHAPLRRWTHAPPATRAYVGGSAQLGLAGELAPGAYLLSARSGGRVARALVLVGSTAMVLKSAGEDVLVWCYDVLTSRPVPDAEVRVWEHNHANGAWASAVRVLRTGADGLARARFAHRAGSKRLFATVRAGERVSVATSGRWHDPDHAARARVLAFTDRPAYRPGQTVNWKALGRVGTGGAWRTAEDAVLVYTVYDPRGATWKEGRAALNAFGSAFGAFDLGQAPALGEYTIEARLEVGGGSLHAGRAFLFRAEEYRLPEFEVRVSAARDDGAPQRFVLGDRVTAAVDVSFYAGGAVAGAEVEVVVTQQPFWRRWPRPWAEHWCETAEPALPWGRDGTIVARERVRTDARGHAEVAFDTPAGTGQDLEYTIEARATDASRREVAGTGRVRVGAREYAVDVRTQHRIHAPGRDVELLVAARDANDLPVDASGILVVTRERWQELWIDPRGRSVPADEIETLRRTSEVFPPPSDRHPWRCVRAEWVSEEVARFTLSTGVDGDASAAFRPRENGLHRARWSSRDARGQAVLAEAWVHVADDAVRDLGGADGGLELVLDRASVEPGAEAVVLVTAPVGDRWVLVTLEGQRLFDARVVHLEGRARLVRMPIALDHVPDVYLSALSAHRGQPLAGFEEISVPPAERLLDVRVRPSREEFRPRERGTVEVEVLDARGEPVRAELALAVIDDALGAIQVDPTPPIDRFFHGERRGNAVQTGGTLDELAFRRWRRDEDGRFVETDASSKSWELRQAGVGGGPFAETRKNVRGARALGQSAPVATTALEAVAGDLGSKHEREGGADGELVVRGDFREVALWKPDLVTGADGRATVEVPFPDGLTRWRLVARAATADTRVGEARGSMRTNQPLVARLQMPRFLVADDVGTLTAVLDNKTDAELVVQADLAFDGPLALVEGRPSSVRVPAGESARVDWLVRATGSGSARVVLRASSAAASDAMERTLECVYGGVESFLAAGGKVRASGELVLALDVPADRVHAGTVFTVDVAPSLAVTMLDALPYLVDYPYGCTEQTLSRFLPAAIVARTLEGRGLSADEALSRAFGGIEPEHAAATHKKPGAGLAHLEAAVDAGLKRLYDFQHGDGGFGWWKEGASDRWMTAYVLWGLSLARDAGVDVRADVLERAARWLEERLVEAQGDGPLAAWMLHALAAGKHSRDDGFVRTALDRLSQQTESLNAYGRALHALAAQGFGRAAEARRLVETLRNGVEIDRQPGESRIGAGDGAAGIATAHWGADGRWWRWSDSPVETTAFALRALMAVDPAHELVEPTVQWLVQNRRGAAWSNTRDTALTVLALDEYLRASGEIARDVEYELFVNGASVARRAVAADRMLRAPARFQIPAESVRDGRNEVKVVRRAGEGPLYVAARCAFTSLEQPVPARGNLVFVERELWRLAPRPTLLAGWTFDRVPLDDGGEMRSGERLIVVLRIEAKNDLEYVLIEDPKPAGLEAVELQSGAPAWVQELTASEVDRQADPRAARRFPDPLDGARSTGRRQWAHRELRDRHTALFLDRLPQGVWEVSYELRAETPGRFRGLPARAEAMYVPEVRGHGTDLRLVVGERAQDG